MTIDLLQRTLAIGLLCLGQSALAAQAYVSLAGPGGSVSQFSAAGGDATRTFATPPGAVDILLNARGNKLYVGTTSLGQADVRSGAPSLIAVMNPSTGAVQKTFAMPGSVVKMVLNPAEDHIFTTGTFATNGTTLVMSLDLRNGKTATAAVPGANPFGLYTIAISPDGGTLYVPSNNGIAIFNAHRLTLIGTISLLSNGIAAPPTITPDGTTLLAVGSGSVYAIDLATRALRKKIPITTSAADFGTALSQDGKTFYASAGTLSAIDVASLSVKGSVFLGQNNPFRLGMSPDGTTLFATDLTYGTTKVVDAASLTVKHTLKSIAPPYAVTVRKDGDALILNENSNGLSLVDTIALTARTSFAVGDAPGAAVLAAGKLFIPEVANLAVQQTPLVPTAVRPISVGFILTDTAVALGNKIYANAGSAVRVIDPILERTTGSFVITTTGGGFGSALSLAASGDGLSLLASYAVFGIDSGPVDGGLVKVDIASGTQLLISSFPLVPGLLASSPDGTTAYAIGFTNGNEVGKWDIANNAFLKTATIPGNPFYVGLAVSRDGLTLYLADQKGKVDFVDAATLQLFNSVAVGVSLSGISLSADGTQALITDATSTSVTVLDLVNPSVTGVVNVSAPSAGSVFLN